MKNIPQGFEEKSVFRHFHEICQIPHGSGNEDALSEYLFNWAKERGYFVVRDKNLNVFIRKKASPGYEDVPPVMLQAHMDMVCEKAKDVEHDFKKDPITWAFEGDLLSTGGRTTLGADDGIGVAIAMAILEDDMLLHPELEVLFTVMEEEDFSGADNFDISLMKSKYLINIDHANEKEILCGSCGGMRADIKIPVNTEAVPEKFVSYRLRISGLMGGHSGEDIHRGRGNANILLARTVMELRDKCFIRLGRIEGGSFRLAIPREAEAILWIDGDKAQLAKEIVSNLEKDFRKEFAVTGKDLMVELVAQDASKWCVEPELITDVVIMIPDGIFQMNEALTGLVDTSNNLGEIYLDENELHIVTEIRSATDSLSCYLFKRMARIAKLFHGTAESSNVYPSWNYKYDSPLRELCEKTYEELGREAPRFITLHAGLEVSYLSMKKPEIDAISIGPDCWNFHSPAEAVSISSTERTVELLRNLLTKIKK